MAAFSAALLMVGFIVDDALIPVRYARHLATDFGYRWNVSAPPSDGVTPLPWSFLLAPFAWCGRHWAGNLALNTLDCARALSCFVGVIGIAVLGARAAKESPNRAVLFSAALTLAVSISLAAHLVTGLETGVAVGLAAVGASLHVRPLRASVVLGLAATFRPELAPWAVTLACGFAFVEASTDRSGPASASHDAFRARAVLVAGLLTLLPFLIVCVLRQIAFGRFVPLALLAKPSDVSHGLRYVVGAFVGAATPLLLLAPRAVSKADGVTKVLVSSVAVHAAVVVLVGGDWMPYARLVAPVVPAAAYAYVRLARFARAWSNGGRFAVAVSAGGFFLFGNCGAARGVLEDRVALIASARVSLAPYARIAALDIGWPSAATEADIVDLAGLTDPEIAALPGGHTSKRVDGALLLARNVDAFLTYVDAPWDPSQGVAKAHGMRTVEARLVADERIQKRFVPRAFLPLGTKGAGYWLWVLR